MVKNYRNALQKLWKGLCDVYTVKTQQSLKLFLDKSVVIPPGSKIVVTQEGQTNAYAQSGPPAVYSVHQEIMLVPFERYA